jgi:hypothetical protein
MDHMSAILKTQCNHLNHGNGVLFIFFFMFQLKFLHVILLNFKYLKYLYFVIQNLFFQQTRTFRK